MVIKKIISKNGRLNIPFLQQWNAYQKTFSEWLNPPKCILCLSKIPTSTLIHQNRITAASSLCSFCVESLSKIISSCGVCNTPLKHGNLCGVCLSTQRYWDHCCAAFEYKGNIRKLIAEFKYQQNPSLGKLLGELMTEHIIDSYEEVLPDYLIPVPAFHDRLKDRGFNQSLILCKELSNRLNIPILDAFKKTKKTPAQKNLSSIRRKSSIKNSFQIRPMLFPSLHSISKVAIIDDVMTTGSTASEIAKLLKKSSISSIEVWVLART